jgi:hypothetical protein
MIAVALLFIIHSKNLHGQNFNRWGAIALPLAEALSRRWLSPSSQELRQSGCARLRHGGSFRCVRSSRLTAALTASARSAPPAHLSHNRALGAGVD